MSVHLGEFDFVIRSLAAIEKIGEIARVPVGGLGVWYFGWPPASTCFGDGWLVDRITPSGTTKTSCGKRG